jgi:hypothetical protein
MSVSINPPYVIEEPNYCMVCGSPMLSRDEIVCYDLKTGDPVYEEVFYCGRSKGHGECRVQSGELSNFIASEPLKFIRDRFSRLFGGLK